MYCEWIGRLSIILVNIGGEKMKYVCSVCDWVYDESESAATDGIAPGTKWADVPDDFACPLCGVGKGAFNEA